MTDRNAAWCLTCDTVIEYKSRPDVISCNCTNQDTRIYVYSGQAYARIGFGGSANLKIWTEEGWV